MNDRRGRSILTAVVAGAVMLAGADATVRRASADVSAPVQLAQFGDMTKQQGSPAPRRTPDGAGGRDQRGENAERPGSPFGAIKK